MAYISKIKYEEASEEVKALIDEQIRENGKITNMKVAITAFATIMIATNIINKSLDIELDDNLIPYSKKG